jgi:type IV conjugative transfer system coupling protein TraD
MSFFGNITRGGQLQIHQLRMFHQIFNFAFLISFIISVIFIGYQINQEYSKPESKYAVEYAKAKFLVRYLNNFSKNDITQRINIAGGSIKVKSRHILKMKKYIIAGEEAKTLLIYRGKQASAIFIGSFILIFVIWFKYGRSQKQTDITKGISLVLPEQLARTIKSEKAASDIEIEGLPLVKDAETRHILITGTTGCGKANLFDIILPQIRKRPNKAIIVDIKGKYVSKYYNPETDFIFNPFDARTINWDIWADCQIDPHYEAFASSIIPDKKNQADDVWDKSSRIVLIEILKKLAKKGQQDPQEIFNVLDKMDIYQLEDFFKETSAAKLISKDADKTTFSVLMNLVSQISSFKYLNNTDSGFSIRKWIENEDNNDPWLFLTARADQIDSISTLMSSFVDTAINASLSLQEKKGRRIWFIADGIPVLNKLPSLKKGLTLGRENGCSIMIGIQDIPQLRSIYGYEDAKTILNNINTHFIFRYQDSTTAKEISEMLGVVEQEKHQETQSYGSSNIKDGVSFSKQLQSKNLVLPIEIANLQVGNAYVKYGGYDITLIKTKLQSLPEIHSGFILKVNQKNITNQLEHDQIIDIGIDK